MSSELTAMSVGEIMPHNNLCSAEIISNGDDSVRRANCSVYGRDEATQYVQQR